MPRAAVVEVLGLGLLSLLVVTSGLALGATVGTGLSPAITITEVANHAARITNSDGGTPTLADPSATPVPPVASQVLPVSGLGVGSSEPATALNLLNGTYTTSLATNGISYLSTGLAYDPATGWAYASGRSAGTVGTALSAVDPTTGTYVRSLGASNCTATGQTSFLLFDSDDGLLFETCGSGRLAGVSPTTGLVETNLFVPYLDSGTACPTEFGSSPIEAASSADLLFVVYSGCETSAGNRTDWVWSVDTVDKTTLALVSSVVVATPYAIESGGTALAFDNATGDLFLYNGTIGTGPNVVVIDPSSGQVVDALTVDTYGDPAVNPMVYDPALGSVLLGSTGYPVTVHHQTTIDTALLRLDLATGGATPFVIWSGHYSEPPIGLQEPYLVPAALSVGPGSPQNLTVFAESDGVGFRGLVYNVSSEVEIDNLSAPPVVAALDLPSDGPVVALGQSSGSVVVVRDSPARSSEVIPVELTLGAGFFATDPSTYYVPVGSYCGTIFDLGGEGGCVNDTIVSLNGTSTQPGEFSTLPAGGAVAATYDPATGDVYVLTVCGEWVSNPATCGALAAPSELTEYSPSGNVLAEAALPFRGAQDTPGLFSIVADPAGHALLLAGPTTRPMALVLVNATTLAIEEESEPANAEGGAPSLAYDATDRLVFAWYLCLSGTTPPLGWCLDALDATNLSLNGSYLATGEGTVLGPQRLTWDPANDTLYATNGTTLFVFSAADARAGPISVVRNPAGLVAIAYDPQDQLLYELGDNLTEVNATTGAIVGQTDLDDSEFAEDALLEVDPATGAAAVTWWPTPYLVLVPPPGPVRYLVTVPEAGLGSTIPWSATVDGATETEVGTHEFDLPNGSYEMTIGPIPGFHRNGTAQEIPILVAGANLTVEGVAFAPTVYSIEAVATSGGALAAWSFSLAQSTGTPAKGPCTGCVNDSTEQSELGTNGSYQYLLRSLAPGYRVEGIAPAGTLTVEGGPIELRFSLVRASTATITFGESGLPSGTAWCASLLGLRERCTTASTFSVPDLTPGTYGYRYASVTGYSIARSAAGSLRVAVPGGRVHRKFAADEYLLSFLADGLRSHTRWKVTVDGKTLSGRTAVLSLSLPDGSYPYATEPVAGYHGGASGTVTISGAGVTVPVGFAMVVYAVTFHEAGLPTGTAWTVDLDGVTEQSNSSTLVFEEGNGTYHYSVSSSAPDYSGTGSPRSVRVDGGPVGVSVSFRLPRSMAPLAGPPTPAAALGAARRTSPR